MIDDRNDLRLNAPECRSSTPLGQPFRLRDNVHYVKLKLTAANFVCCEMSLGDNETARALTAAHAIVTAWLVHGWHPALHQRWSQRLDTIIGPPPHRPGTRAGMLPAAIHPEIATITDAVLSFSAGEDEDPEHKLLALAQQLGLPDGRVPGERDPLRRLLAPPRR